MYHVQPQVQIRRLGLVLVCLLLASPVGVVEGTTSKVPNPMAGRSGRRFITRASWYGYRFARRKTASGRKFDPKELTGAHRTLPLGSDVRVTHLGNGRSVVVRITDRGPYVSGRGIDLSLEAAKRLGMVRQGVAKVQLEVLPEVKDRRPVPTALASWLAELPSSRAILR